MLAMIVLVKASSMIEHCNFKRKINSIKLIDRGCFAIWCFILLWTWLFKKKFALFRFYATFYIEHMYTYLEWTVVWLPDINVFFINSTISNFFVVTEHVQKVWRFYLIRLISTIWYVKTIGFTFFSFTHTWICAWMFFLVICIKGWSAQFADI